MQLAARGQQDVRERRGFLESDVAALQNAGAPDVRRNIVQHGHGLARERDQGRPVHALEGSGVSAGRFFGIAGADHVEIRNQAQRGNRLDRLVRRAVFAHADGVVRVDIKHRQFRQRSDTHRRTRVIGEHQKGRDAGAENSVVSDAVGDRRHAVFADAEADIASTTVGRIEVRRAVDEVERRAVEIGATTDQQREFVRDRLENVAAGRACATEFDVGGEERGFLQQVRRARSHRGRVEERRFFRISRTPSLEGLLPLVGSADEASFVIGEISADVVADVEMIRRQTERGAGRLGEFRPTLAVAFGGALDFGDAFADDRLRDDELRFFGLGFFGLVVGLQDRSEIVAVDGLHVPADRLEALCGVFALRLIRHRVEGDVVGVVDENQVIELLVAGERDRLHRDAFLHAAVAGETHDVIIKNRVLGGVETRGRHLAGHRHADGVTDALAERARGALDAGGLVEFRMSGRGAVQRAEFLHLLDRQIVAAQMEPTVEKHRTVAGREDETVTIEPTRAVWVVHERVAVKNRADLGRTQGQTEVARRAGVNSVDGEATRLVSGFG